MARVGNLLVQLRAVDPKKPWLWPAWMRSASFVAVGLAVMGLAWVIYLGGELDAYAQAQAQESQQREAFVSRLGRAKLSVSAAAEKLDAESYVTLLEAQLPGKADMDSLFAGINRAGINAGLQFKVFRPGAERIDRYYAELPVDIKVSGDYLSLGRFATELAVLSRIVSLGDIRIDMLGPDGRPLQGDLRFSPRQVGGKTELSMEAVVTTYRYLDAEETRAQIAKEAAAKKAALKAKRVPVAPAAGKGE